MFRALGGILAVSTKMEAVAPTDADADADSEMSAEAYSARLAKALPPHAPLMPRRFPHGIPSAAKGDGHEPLLDTRAAIAAEMAMLREASDLSAEEVALRSALHELDQLHEMIERFEGAAARAAKVISPPDAPSSPVAPGSPAGMRIKPHVILEESAEHARAAEAAAALASGVKAAWPAKAPGGMPSYDSTIDMNLDAHIDAAREALEAVGEA